MQPQGAQRPHHRCRHASADGSDVLDRNSSDLFGLRFGVHPQSRLGGRQQGLEGADSRVAAGDRHEGHDTETESGSGGVGPIATYNKG